MDASPDDMSALLSYLDVLGTRSANVPAVHRVPSQPAATGASGARLLARVSASAAAGSDIGGSNKMSASVAAGQQLFEERACFACHGQAGSGGRAPAVAPLIAKLSDSELKQILENPSAKMKQGGMPPIAGDPEQIGSLVSYLRTLRVPEHAKQAASESAAHEKPAAPELHASPVTTDTAVSSLPATSGEVAHIAAVTEHAAGRQLFHSQGCFACHGGNAQGTQLAPSLSGVAVKYPGDKLPTLLRYPTPKMQKGGMPAVTLDDAQFSELLSFLSSLEAVPAEQAVNGQPKQANAEPHFTAPQSLRQAAGANQTAEREKSNVSLDPLVLRGKRVFQRNACATCHGVEGFRGTVAAPGLAETASTLSETALEKLLRHHSARMQKGGMPLTSFGEQDLKAIVAYIRSLAQGDGEHLASVHRN